MESTENLSVRVCDGVVAPRLSRIFGLIPDSPHPRKSFEGVPESICFFSKILSSCFLDRFAPPAPGPGPVRCLRLDNLL